MTLALLWKLARSPWLWLAVLLASNVVTVALWRRGAAIPAVGALVEQLAGSVDQSLEQAA